MERQDAQRVKSGKSPFFSGYFPVLCEFTSFTSNFGFTSCIEASVNVENCQKMNG